MTKAKYYITQGKNYWLQSGRGHTTNAKEAGKFTLQEIADRGFNLDLCTLRRSPMTS